jgi:hypothetical protein
VITDEGVQRNVDYNRFKLFHLAILWRAHESSLHEFRHVQLGETAEVLREALESGIAPKPSDFPIAGQAVVSPLDHHVFHALIAMPVRFRLKRGWVYAPLYAGCLWYIGITPEVLAKDPTALQSNGNIVIPVVSVRRLPAIAKIMFRNRKSE